MFVNLHRYYPSARYPGDYRDAGFPPDVSGREAYHRYLADVAAKFVPQVGGRVWLAGPVDMTFIGEGDWDEIVIGRYPSKADAMRVPALPGYDAIAVHRTAGLEQAQTLVVSPERLVIDVAASTTENQ